MMASLIAESWETLKEAIVAYTGVSPATFFTALFLAVALYHVISSCFAAPPPPRYREREFVQSEPLPPPVQLGEVTEEELKQYDGSDPKKPLLMAIKGQIYDVSQSRMFYGPGGPYALFAGKDASRALAKMSFEEKDLTGDISGLGPFELEALQDWEYKFMSKYIKVGTIKKPDVAVGGEPSGNANDTSEASSENGPSVTREVGDEHVAEASSENGHCEPRKFGSEHATAIGSEDSHENDLSEPKVESKDAESVEETKEFSSAKDHNTEPEVAENSEHKTDTAEA